MSLAVASHSNSELPKGVAAVPKVRGEKEAKPSKSKHKLTEAQIAVHWKEEHFFRPSKKFIAQAILADPAFVKKFSENIFRNVSTTTPIFSIGTSPGARLSTLPTHPSGSGL